MQTKIKTLTVLTVIFAMELSLHFLGGTLASQTFHMSDLLLDAITPHNIVALTNKARLKTDLPALKISRKLAKAAQQKADDMLKDQYFSHNAPSGKTPWEFLKESRYPYLYAGENLAIHFQAAEEVLKGWMASQGHRENILSDRYSEIGIGIAQGRFLGFDTTIVVQMFGHRLKASPLRLSGAEFGKNAVFLGDISVPELFAPGTGISSHAMVQAMMVFLAFFAFGLAVRHFVPR